MELEIMDIVSSIYFTHTSIVLELQCCTELYFACVYLRSNLEGKPYMWVAPDTWNLFFTKFEAREEREYNGIIWFWLGLGRFSCFSFFQQNDRFREFHWKGIDLGNIFRLGVFRIGFDFSLSLGFVGSRRRPLGVPPRLKSSLWPSRCSRRLYQH